MEEERKRRLDEGGDKSPKHVMSDQQAAVLEEVSRKVQRFNIIFFTTFVGKS